jgi:hypothetical protein
MGLSRSGPEVLHRRPVHFQRRSDHSLTKVKMLLAKIQGSI